ncbi:MAG: hypothetical protein UX04_C0003G0067 [Microgenomates group bacterium GW2011_GWF2_45_18]|nr:MAG: hypothetical protein UW18_C0002G0067 [Microgenomates group bacterium GW2011_GWF1_44_10]KKU01795.1 MAG: hypothetical protein UX04_C0003G0067 [Microgenomates group bacterium GW2011_GWF2_45_18]
MACFTVKELIDLLLLPVELSLLNKTLEVRLEGRIINNIILRDLAMKWSKNSVNSKDYEYWVAILLLYEDFGEDSEICFYLKDTFNHYKDTITSYTDLEKFKQDPPDVIIKNKFTGYAEFELKRYRDEVSEKGLISCIKTKILRYSVAYNYCIILQNTSESELTLKIFENIHETLIKLSLNRDLGKICFIFNANNQHMIFAHVFPDFIVFKQPINSGSDQVKKFLKQK